ncbi:hypothetical protein [Paraflavitalea speifideaquila]|uniref:hypothetical protein n=1 Tax=Paraflavitalea speifideaquila TaxID=3076558 RepID=UPI0028ED614D|nr:hypothetical protein [Paraflavitalea speifideiaquila]
MRSEQLLLIKDIIVRKTVKTLLLLLTVVSISLPALARQQDDGIEDNIQLQQLTGVSLVLNATAVTAFPRALKRVRPSGILSA